MKMADMTITVSMNYFNDKNEYIGTVLCLPDNRFMLIAPDETRKLMPKGAQYQAAAQELVAPWLD